MFPIRETTFLMSCATFLVKGISRPNWVWIQHDKFSLSQTDILYCLETYNNSRPRSLGTTNSIIYLNMYSQATTSCRRVTLRALHLYFLRQLMWDAVKQTIPKSRLISRKDGVEWCRLPWSLLIYHYCINPTSVCAMLTKNIPRRLR